MLPESISVQIDEFDSFFTVDISFRNMEASYESSIDDIEAFSNDDFDVENLDYNEGATWTPFTHTHTLFFFKDASYAKSRDEILMKLKLAFPNHTYGLRE